MVSGAPEASPMQGRGEGEPLRYLLYSYCDCVEQILSICLSPIAVFQWVRGRLR